MSYSPRKIPKVCPECGFLICKCYVNEINTGNDYAYDPASTEPEQESFNQSLNLENNCDFFEFNDMANHWR